MHAQAISGVLLAPTSLLPGNSTLPLSSTVASTHEILRVGILQQRLRTYTVMCAAVCRLRHVFFLQLNINKCLFAGAHQWRVLAP